MGVVLVLRDDTAAREAQGTSERYEGLMDELAFFDRALLPSEVLALFEDGLVDGVGDACDLCQGDDATGDIDGVCDDIDACAGFDDSLDADTDGVPGCCDLCPGYDDSVDCNSNGIPGGCENTGDRMSFNDPEPLNNNADTDSGDDYVSQVTTDGAGAWVAVWQSMDSLGGDTIGNDWDILVAR